MKFPEYSTEGNTAAGIVLRIIKRHNIQPAQQLCGTECAFHCGEEIKLVKGGCLGVDSQGIAKMSPEEAIPSGTPCGIKERLG